MEEPQQRYRVLDRLAAGGMAEVFVAESAGIEGFRKVVAIKRVLPHLAANSKFISRFLDEARLSAKLAHSNVVHVFDIGVGDNAYFLVMEYVDGASLREVMSTLRQEGRPFPVAHALHIAIEVCEGLAYAHAARNDNGEALDVIHRDISPSNILLSRYGEVKVSDFGLAKATTQLEEDDPNVLVGKFGYHAPEMALGEAVDWRADIFAVGIVLWELLAGRRLFVGETDYETVRLVQHARVPPIRELRPEVDGQLEAVILKALSRERDARYASAESFADALVKQLFRSGTPVTKRDVAALVREAARKRVKARPVEGQSIIDKLIQEALFEFTSIDKSAASDETGPTSAFADIGTWADELAEQGADAPRAPLAMHNLAALDDDEVEALRPPRPSPAPVRIAPLRPEASEAFPLTSFEEFAAWSNAVDGKAAPAAKEASPPARRPPPPPRRRR